MIIYRKVPPPKRRTFLVGFFFVSLLIISMGVLSFFLLLRQFSINQKNVYILSPLARSIEHTFNPQVATLQSVVEQSIADAKGTYAVAIKNLQTGESYYTNENMKFEAASLYKLWVMATAYQMLEKGSLSENEILHKDVTVLNKEFGISSDSAELQDGNVEMSVKDALYQMITISHNYAALLLADRVKLSNVSKFLADNDFYESSLGQPPLTTASDIELFFEKLKDGELAGPLYTKKMIDLLKEQKLNDKLPKYLPDSVDIAHKTGEIDYFSHDSGLVYGSKGDYIIVILSKTDYPPGAEERIASISKAVYDYFEN